MLPPVKLLEVLKNNSFHRNFESYGYLRVKNITAVDNQLCEDYLQQTFLNSGRYNDRGQSTIYLADSRETLNRQIVRNNFRSNQSLNEEIRFYVIRHNHFRHIKFSFNFSKVIDLRDNLIQNQLDINLEELILAEPRNLLEENPFPTQILGDIARKIGYDGLIVPVDRNSETDHYIVIFKSVIEKVEDDYYRICP